MKLHHGQTLVEMIVIVGIVVVLVTGIIAGTSISFSRTQDDQLRSTALSYAQEGIELTRQQRDQGWSGFALLGTNKTVYCVGSDKDYNVISPTDLCTGPFINGKYVRSIVLELLNPGDPVNEKMSVDVVVTWSGSAATPNKVELQTYLTKWK